VNELTPDEMKSLIETTGEQISFRADTDVRAWVALKRHEGYEVKGYVQRLIRDDMRRAGAKVDSQKSRKARPKARAGGIVRATYAPTKELTLA